MAKSAWVSTRKGLFELRRSRGRWRVARASFVGEPVTMALPYGAGGRVLAALKLGHFDVKCHITDDGGTSWREVAAPAYPPQPDTAKDEAPWKLVQIWSLAASGDTLWAGTHPGGLFRSDDNAASWQLVDSLWQKPERKEWFGGGYDVAGIHSICIDPRDPRRMLLGISCGGAWFTEDGGAGWRLRAAGMRALYMPPQRTDDQNIQDPHLIAQCEGAPDVLWCQHHCGIWRSTDAGISWHEVTGVPLSSFGFAVAVHPRDPDTAWFVPAVADQRRVPVDGALAVNRTRDGGRSFETLRNGLPQKDCYDLIYRHCLAVADDGCTLLMGSTTGNVWISEDAGDRWQAVSMNLPPVYAVRFGLD